MRFIDLSREIYHRTPAHPAHPPVVMTTWNDHEEVKEAGGVKFSSKAMSISMSDHAATHIDAPVHFDPRVKVDGCINVGGGMIRHRNRHCLRRKFNTTRFLNLLMIIPCCHYHWRMRRMGGSSMVYFS